MRISFRTAASSSLIVAGVVCADGSRYRARSVVLATGTDLGEGALDVGQGASRLQTGLLRTYVLFLGTGLAVVGIVFLVVR